MIKSAIAQVRGRVQGVGFRYSAMNRARTLGLRGWVRNEVDGSVTARFEGFSENVDMYISWLEEGPAGAKVQDLKITDLNPDDSLGDFRVLF